MAKGKAKFEKGKWAFLLGLIVAVISAFYAFGPWDGLLMLLLGIAVGVLNVDEKEATNFIIATLGLSIGSMAIASGNLDGVLGYQVAGWISALVANVIVLAGAATLVVALKRLYFLAKA